MFSGKVENDGTVRALYISHNSLKGDELVVSNDLRQAKIGEWMQAQKTVLNPQTSKYERVAVIEPEICRFGFHGSLCISHAENYNSLCPGNTLCLIELSGLIGRHTDKLVGSFRKIVAARTISSWSEACRVRDMDDDALLNWIHRIQKGPKRDALGRFTK